jgi:ADP-heptose:LPS heptosyltransferase
MVVTASEELENSRLNPGRYIIVHSGRVGWKGRDLPPETWAEIRDDLAREFPERQVLCIDRGWPEELRRSAALIAGADLFVGPDSFPATLAYATGAPAVVLFGSINPRWRLPPTGSFRSVQARGLECLGCHHELPAPRVFTDCPREPEADYAPCMDNIDPEQVTMAAKAVIRKVENAVEIV